MARRPRIDFSGYHHVINRGVDKGDVVRADSDKDLFLQILCKSLKKYHALLHSYCLMDNHYHLLIETTAENLSLLMRNINANYAIYFNKKYKRTGHLWQGRYKYRYITHEPYLYELLRYIEHNPIRAKIATRLDEYTYSSYRQFTGLEPAIACLKNSLLFQWYETAQDVAAFFDMGEGGAMEMIEKEIRKADGAEIDVLYERRQEKKPLEEYFKKVNTIKERNSQIMEAHDNGWSQHKIAKEVKLSQGMVNRIVNGNR